MVCLKENMLDDITMLLPSVSVGYKKQDCRVLRDSNCEASTSSCRPRILQKNRRKRAYPMDEVSNGPVRPANSGFAEKPTFIVRKSLPNTSFVVEKIFPGPSYAVKKVSPKLSSNVENISPKHSLAVKKVATRQKRVTKVTAESNNRVETPSKRIKTAFTLYTEKRQRELSKTDRKLPASMLNAQFLMEWKTLSRKEKAYYFEEEKKGKIDSVQTSSSSRTEPQPKILPHSEIVSNIISGIRARPSATIQNSFKETSRESLEQPEQHRTTFVESSSVDLSDINPTMEFPSDFPWKFVIEDLGVEYFEF